MFYRASCLSRCSHLLVCIGIPLLICVGGSHSWCVLEESEATAMSCWLYKVELPKYSDCWRILSTSRVVAVLEGFLLQIQSSSQTQPRIIGQFALLCRQQKYFSWIFIYLIGYLDSALHYEILQRRWHSLSTQQFIE